MYRFQPRIRQGEQASPCQRDRGDRKPANPVRLIAPIPVAAPRTIKVTAPQIQYSQQVFLNFNGLTWPHVAVATLVPASPVPVPASAWA